MDRRRGDEVAPTHDVGHPLQRVVDHHRQMIARSQTATLEDHIAPNAPARPDAARERRPRHIRPSEDRAGARSSARRMSSRNAAPSPRARRSRASVDERARQVPDRAARRPGRAVRSRRARSPSGCKNRGRQGRAHQGARAPPHSPRHARSVGAAARESEVQARRDRPGSRPRIAACSASGPGPQGAAAARPPSSWARRSLMRAE